MAGKHIVKEYIEKLNRPRLSEHKIINYSKHTGHQYSIYLKCTSLLENCMERYEMNDHRKLFHVTSVSETHLTSYQQLLNIYKQQGQSFNFLSQ